MKNATNTFFHCSRRAWGNQPPPALLTASRSFLAGSHGPADDVRGPAGRSCCASPLWGAEIEWCCARFGAAAGARNRSRSLHACARRDMPLCFAGKA